MQKLAVVSLLSSSILAGPAFAQDAQKPADNNPTMLDKIIITGRDDRSISSVAQSVQVIDQNAIGTAVGQGENASDLIARLVPGYAPRNETISGASETFRGRSVLIMVDGVPRNTPLRDVSRILATIDLDTVERVEIINGASSLYGAGATGGTINFITKRGTSDTPKVTVRTGVTAFTENFGKSAAPSGNVQVEGRSGDFDYFASASGNFSCRTYDGHGNEMASDAMLGQGGGDRTGWGDLSGVVGYENGSKRIELSADWTYARQKADWFTDYLSNPVKPNFSDAYTGEPLIEDSKYLAAKYTDSDFALGKLELKAFYNDIFKQSPFTKFSRVNSQVYLPTNPARPTLLPINRDPTASFNQTALEVQRSGINATVNTPVDFITQGSTLTWGFDFTHDQTGQTLLNGQDAIAPSSQNSVAAFAQAEVPVTDRFRLQGGVRFDQFYLDVDNFKRPAAAVLAGSNLVGLPAIDVVGGSFDYNATTFNAGAVFDITPELQAFGNFSQGFSLTDIGGFTRRAGLNTNAETCDAYGTSIRPLLPCTNAPDYRISYADIAPEPQVVNTWEGGLRGDWGNVRGGASAYLSTSDNGVNYDIAANRVSQQKERIWGFEANAEYDISEMFTLGGSVGYVEGKYDANRDGKIGSDEYLPNNRIPTTYKGLAYVVTHFDNNLTLRTELEMFSGRDRIASQELDGAVLANIGVTKKFAGGQELNFAVRNLFDTYYVNPTASATRGADVPGLGRTIAASFKVTF
ncbi:TonB-dependent receptor [Mesorhizobium retamae]|uniref:TonB-dependent receptor n=1 Tax=Mesorhizobium retamae TaxID=2912854 RepID=A0ABS9QDX3_9HYPH|nr:TonB-dependent receptor [Mesorhizobium sp. IRAMC:0171]MCG7505616.1 TonB-dependent receptor [Mesorhizobium sp. IRAMC:0171]